MYVCKHEERLMTLFYRVHLQYHYDIYYSVIGQRAKEVWVSRRLGGRPERNPRTRACLHCSQARGTRKFFEGRIKLLKHIAKVRI